MTGTTETGCLPPAPGRIPPAHSAAAHCDRDGFVRAIYDQYGSELQRYAARLLDGDWHKAEDILQETAARAWKHAAFLQTRGEGLRPWLFTVIRNLAIDHHRARRLRPLQLVPLEELDVAAESPDHQLTLHLVLDALQDLNEQQRTVIRLMYYLECGVARTAEHLGVPPGTVKSRAFYAMRALREALRARGVHGDE
ncbi:sigma-70 family RNA polymerase sigma factor [Streptomyces sp. NPDC018964]|uniref:sigma-70 family RNA polymerase sigma factor n=1 Tax=Streptomyces sp. NPDC018964 TaxID=3365058 RepID=UPI00379123AC